MGLKKSKKKAWDAFSKYVRLRDALKTTGTHTHAKCYTCLKRYPAFGKGCLQAGHFIPGRNNSILIDEVGVNAQCLTRHSSLLLANGDYKPIEDIVPGDTLQAFDEDTFRRRSAVVEHVSKFLPEKLYEVTLEDGGVFYATPDHRLVVNNEWVTVEELLHRESVGEIMEL